MSTDVMYQSPPRLEAWAGQSLPPSGLRSKTPSPKGSRKLDRPKSSPSHLKVTFSPSVSPEPPQPARPTTAAGAISGYECDRLYQVEHEATRKHKFENHFGPKKGKPPPWQKNLDTPMVPYSTGPGYTMSKSKNKLAVTLKMDDFFNPRPEEKQAQKKTAILQDSHREEFVRQLQQQIEDLTLYLEEERLNHRHTKDKAAQNLQTKVKDMNQEQEEHVRELEAEHQEQMKRMKASFDITMAEYKSSTEATISRMKGEIEFLHGSFESFKSSLTQEMNTKWKRKEEEIEYKHKENIQSHVHEMKLKMIQEKNAEKATLTKEFQKQLSTLQKEHKKELDVRFLNIAQIH
ncbi:inner centromere protein-like [Lingula anatina]|uniref:Inner centromere protein-like n=1 Tax=Lingula anatina TaxID=7574 RepID=A0A1S3JDG2_LINAN|nr:inner centromere protein-like [Lingula anatina]|eukprot:XP_013408455.1 inner centromere protein-like [Lingula anatina]